MSAEPNTYPLTAGDRLLTIALAGNPNAGKTTLFNALTGLRQKVANYPGVTVERKEGIWKGEETAFHLIDLPGLYSLDAASPDEQISRDVLTGKIENLPAPDAIVAVVDATNLERNLYLVTQLLDYKVPLIVALTMFDEVEKERTEIDIKKLSELLRVPVVPVTASTHRGLDELKEQVLLAMNSTPSVSPFQITGETKNSEIIKRYKFLSDVVQETVSQKESVAATVTQKVDRFLTHKIWGFPLLIALVFLIFVVIYSLAALPMDLLNSGFGLLGKAVEKSLPPTLFTQMLVGGVIPGVGAVLVFLPQIILLFFFISILEDAGYMVRAAFLLDRLMGKVGLNGKAFLPLFSSFACAIPGIMATRTIGDPKDRITTILIAPFMSCSARLPVYFLMIPVFLGGSNFSGALVIIGMYAIGIVTALVVAFFLKRNILKAPTPPLVMEMPPYRVPSPKSVLLNVYQNAGMFVRRAGTIIFVLSIVLWWLTVFPLPADEPVAGIEILMMGILVAVIIILGVKKLIGVFATRKVSLRPASSTAERTGLWHSLRSNYGMAIVVLTIIAWAAIAYSPGSRNAQAVAVEQSASAPSVAEALEKKKVQTENSYAGRLGRAIEPAVRPLGFDDEMGFALIASFAAREVFVSALKIIHTGAEDEPQTPGEVWTTYREDVGTFWGNVFSLNFSGIIYKEDTENRPLVERYSPLTALSTMVFFVLAMQCMSTLAIVRRETNSWKYPIVMFVYMTVLAYVVSLLTYQGGSLLLGILR